MYGDDPEIPGSKEKEPLQKVIFYVKWAPSKLINHNNTIKQVKDYLIHVILPCFQMPAWSLHSSLHVMLLLDVHMQL